MSPEEIQLKFVASFMAVQLYEYSCKTCSVGAHTSWYLRAYPCCTSLRVLYSTSTYGGTDFYEDHKINFFCDIFVKGEKNQSIFGWFIFVVVHSP